MESSLCKFRLSQNLKYIYATSSAGTIPLQRPTSCAAIIALFPLVFILLGIGIIHFEIGHRTLKDHQG